MNSTAERFLPAVDPRAAREAAQWLMQLYSAQCSEIHRQDCKAWRAADPANELAWQRAEMVSRTLGMVPPAVGMPVLDRPALLERRAAIKTMAMLIAASPIVWAAYRAAPWQEWTAGTRTAKGEIRHMTLGDGTRLTLNTETAIDIAFDDTTRLVKLHAGEIHIETAPDPVTRARPFVVQSDNGRVRAIGTRFSVRQENSLINARTHVAVTQGSVEIRPGNAYHTLQVIAAGQQASFDGNAVSALSAVTAHADTWVNGVLVADDTPLQTIVDQIARYRPGVLRCHPSIADLRVSGAFQLKDTDNILHLLQRSLPIRVQKRTRYWVSLEPAA